ncbi:MAG: hypothetical protein ACI84K_000986 [Pseudohongiellaceae bacterium]|jgi:hypothetical protein
MLVAVFVAVLFTIILYRRKKTVQQRKQFIIKALVSVLVISLMYLTLTGRMHALVAIAAGVIPFLSRLLPLIKYIPILRNFYQQKKATQQADDSQVSKVETSLLSMTLNHETGHMDGQVLAGQLAEKKLSECSTEQLLDLYQLAKNDHPDSLSILEAYLDREVGEHWRKNFEEVKKGQTMHTNDNEMSTSEALDILGLNSDASRTEIIAAHRKLIQKLHPDRGGSNYLAAKLNQAKALLLNQL